MGGLALGNNMILNIDKTKPDFKNEYTAGPELFPAACVFNKEEWAKPENHMKIVTEAENRSVAGDQGQFAFVADFSITLLAAYESEEECQKVLALLPNPEAWAKFVIG
mgnify:CR=1 FL=1